ncbi:MAG: flagellar hook-associated protein FlgK [Rhodobacteraceae bacterium]|nr:flagellar hook-associated protein FlgK [Paracoccaceae bacterium]
MSISGSLFNAYSGLKSAARTAEAISNNVANAMTIGYGRREVELSAASINGRGAGVQVAGVLRLVDQVAISDRLLAESALGGNRVRADAFARLESAIGTPGDGSSLSDRVTEFEAALLDAEGRPDAEVRLRNVLFAAKDLIATVGGISDETQEMRMSADAGIGRQVGILNETLSRIETLNHDIRLHVGGGGDVNGLLDQRQQLVDKLAEIVPIKTYQRDHGQIAIVSIGGVSLLDGSAAEFGFSPTGLITPEMDLASGALSALQVNGKDISIGTGSGGLEGGSLSALFQVRDVIAPKASAQIDAFARNLMERFEAGGLDSTLNAGDAGLFTDGGGKLDTALETGLAGRLALNVAVDPDQGGVSWRLRDGLGALVPGDVGDNSLLLAFSDALTNGRAPLSGSFSPHALSLAGLSGDLTALNSTERLHADEAEAFATSRYQALLSTELDAGVDTDQEMQKLLLVEQAYAANARVVSTVDEMLRAILEM